MKKTKNCRSPEQALKDFANFCVLHDKCPNQRSNDLYEKSLAQCVSNYKRNRHSGKNTFSDEQFNRILSLQSKYGIRAIQKKPYEKYEILHNFCTSYGHWPSQSSPDEQEKRIYETCCRDQYYASHPDLLKKYNSLKEQYLSFLSPSEVMKELRLWVQHYKTTPRENSNNGAENKLARNIKYLKSRKKFSPEELDEVEDISAKFGPRGGTSIYEQILYYYLQSATDFALVTNRNSERFGPEVDVLIEHTSVTVAVFFDGSAFHQNAEQDNSVNRFLNEKGVIVLRFREEGCPQVIDCISIPVSKGISYQNFLVTIDKYFKSNDCPICDIISNEDVDAEDILGNACLSGSSHYLVRGHLINYIDNALLTNDKPKTDSKIYRNCKGCQQRHLFSDKEKILYAFVKRLFDSSPRKRRNIDTPSITNDDVELLYQIFEVFYKTTPYGNGFKDDLIKRITLIE